MKIVLPCPAKLEIIDLETRETIFWAMFDGENEQTYEPNQQDGRFDKTVIRINKSVGIHSPDFDFYGNTKPRYLEKITGDRYYDGHY